MRLILTVLACLAIVGAANADPPKPTQSEYLLSTGAGFSINAVEGLRYAMSFDVVKELSAPLYVTTVFPSTSRKGDPSKVLSTLSAGATELSVQSEKLTEIKNCDGQNV